jgi:nitrile hydratase
MNGPHDLGGMMGFGPIAPESNEPVFHAEWERRAFAVTLAMGASRQWGIDQSRFARESTPPAEYLSSTCYEIWLAGLARLMRERGMLEGEPQAFKKLTKDRVAPALARGGPVDRPARTPARFKPGDRVRALNIHPEGHTRLPRYVRGHVGEIVRVHGAHVYPDSNAKGLGEDPHWLYAVSFSAKELWGHDTADSVTLDLWEPYLEPAA